MTADRHDILTNDNLNENYYYLYVIVIWDMTEISLHSLQSGLLVCR